MATYEITQALDGDIKDLRTSLARADIPIATEQRDERIRRFKLTPEERERESLEHWNAVVAQVEDQWG
jgi:plasmid stabilization system protein ParE